MTEQEFEEQKSKVDEYQRLKRRAEKYRESAKLAMDGIITINCIYAKTVDVYGMGEEARNKLAKHIHDFFEQEAQAIEKSMEEI